MIRIAICDDSEAFLKQTKFMIEHWDAPVAKEIVTESFGDGDALLHAHARKPFDIILMDIVMPLLNGIEATRELREKDGNVKIVFLTSSPEYAVESYTVKASNYLLKPVNPDSLFACLDELIGDIQSVAKSIPVKSMEATYRIALADIEYVEAQLKHAMFYLKGGRTMESTDAFHLYEDALSLDDGFFKCHRSYIVNIHQISNYTHNEIIMRSGRRIPISRSCQKNFDSVYFRVVFGKVENDL